MSSRASNQPTSVAVAVCTYERSGPLEVLLRALVRLAKRKNSPAALLHGAGAPGDRPNDRPPLDPCGPSVKPDSRCRRSPDVTYELAR